MQWNSIELAQVKGDTTMNNKIAEWCKANPKPVQTLCPRVIQYWSSSKGTMYWDSETGERTNYNPNGDSNRYYKTVSVRPYYWGFYMRYVEELDALEISTVCLKGNRGKDGEIKEWIYDTEYHHTYVPCRVFMFKGTVDAYDQNGNEIYGEKKKYVHKGVDLHFGRMLSYLRNRKAKEELEKFVGSAVKIVGWSGAEIAEPYVYNYREWYNKDFMPRNVKANVLLNYELSDANFYPVGDKPSQAYFEMINDDLAVIRYFRFPCKWNNNTNTYRRIEGEGEGEENCRIYLTKKGKATVAHNQHGTWKTNVGGRWDRNRATCYVNYEKMLEFQPLKYVLPCMGEKNSAQDILDILRHPIIEQLIKAGYPKIATRIAREGHIAANLRDMFSIAKEKKLSLYKLLGVNKEFLKLLNENLDYSGFGYYRNNPSINARLIKELYGRNDISDLSKETIEMLFNALKECRFVEMLPQNGGYMYWRDRNGHEYTDDERKLILKLCKAEQRHEGIIRAFNDTCKTYNRISEANRPDIDLTKFDGYDDIIRLHNELVEIQCREEEEHRALRDASERERLEKMKEKFEKMQDERKAKYEYEEDDFCVRIPKELMEIKTEGMMLSHCVGGYTDRHALGETNILFLRKRSEENVPFYTIEIKNNRVVQIHGSHNKWLGNDPKAVPFMYRYLTKLGVSFDKSMLLNKGMGYGMGKESLPESYLTAA